MPPSSRPASRRPTSGRPASRRPAGPPPTEASLREAALRHLERFAATSTTLARVLANRIRRWQMAAEREDAAELAAAARAAIPRVIARLAESGALDDAAFAESRARRLARAGGSRRKIAAHLAARGVSPGIETDDFAAALAYARRRRLPPFGTAEPLKALAALARAGFSREVATRVLATGREAAEDAIRRLQQG